MPKTNAAQRPVNRKSALVVIEFRPPGIFRISRLIGQDLKMVSFPGKVMGQVIGVGLHASKMGREFGQDQKNTIVFDERR
jgi:hypothetical protein